MPKPKITLTDKDAKRMIGRTGDLILKTGMRSQEVTVRGIRKGLIIDLTTLKGTPFSIPMDSIREFSEYGSKFIAPDDHFSDQVNQEKPQKASLSGVRSL